jgi:hypothetical protein
MMRTQLSVTNLREEVRVDRPEVATVDDSVPLVEAEVFIEEGAAEAEAVVVAAAEVVGATVAEADAEAEEAAPEPVRGN